MKKKFVVYVLLASLVFSSITPSVYASGLEIPEKIEEVKEENQDDNKDQNKDTEKVEEKKEQEQENEKIEEVNKDEVIESNKTSEDNQDNIKEDSSKAKKDETTENKDSKEDIKEDKDSKENLKPEESNQTDESKEESEEDKKESEEKESEEKEEKVKISFYVDDEVFDEVEIVKGSSVEDIKTPEKDYMDFVGFFDGDTEFDSSMTFDKDFSFKAKFEKTVYKINYELDGGEAENLPESYTYFDEDLQIPNLSKENYIFEGWDIDGENIKDYVISKNSSGDVTLKAVFSLNFGLYDNDGNLVKSFNSLVKDNFFVVEEDSLKRGDNEDFESLEGVLRIPDDIKVISSSTFENSKFSKILLSSNLEVIESDAFKNCENLEELVLPESLKSIGSNFINGTKIESIFIDKNIETIEVDALSSSSLKEINVSEDNENYLSDSGILYNKDKNTLIKYPEALEENVLNISVSTIKENAFSNAKVNRINLNSKTITLESNSLNSKDIKAIRILDWADITFGENVFDSETLIYYTGENEDILKFVNTPIYHITYDLDGGNTKNKTIFNELDDFTLDVPTRDGYDFLYWELNEENVGKNFSVKNLSEDITLKAVWEVSSNTPYKVVYKIQSVIDTEVYETYLEKDLKGKMDTPVTPEVIEIKGFVSPKEKTENIKADGSLVIEYLYDRESYKLSVEKDENIALVNYKDTYLYGENVTVGVLFKDGYELDKVLGVKSLMFEMPNEDVEISITSKMSEYSIKYDLDGGYLKDGAKNRTSYNVETDSFIISNPYCDDREFLGWSKNDSKEIVKTVMVEKGSTGDITLKAIFSDRKYIINFDGNESSGEMDSLEVNYIDEFYLPENSFEKDGYEFIGWMLDGKILNPDEKVSKLTLEKEVTLKAVWKIINYSITYGTVEDKGENKEIYTIEDEDFTLINPEREGYKFIGWTGSNGLIPEEIVTIYKGETGNKTYIANWEKLTLEKGITIIWNDDNDELRPESYILYLYRNGELYKTITVSSKDDLFNLDDLEKFDENGMRYVYTWKTEVSPRYQTSIDDEGNVTFSKKNTYYSINIPKNISLSGEEDVSKYEISVEGESYLNDSIEIIPSETISISSDGKEDILLSVKQIVTKVVQKTNKEENFKDDESVSSFDEEGKAVITGEIDTSEVTAGNWNGAIEFTIIHTEQN